MERLKQIGHAINRFLDGVGDLWEGLVMFAAFIAIMFALAFYIFPLLELTMYAGALLGLGLGIVAAPIFLLWCAWKGRKSK